MQNKEDGATATSGLKPKGSIPFKILKISGITLGILCLLLFIQFRKYIPIGEGQVCLSRIHSVGQTALLYVEDHDGKLPPTDKWQEIFISKYNCDPKTMACPSASRNESTYAININIAGKNLNEIPEDTVMFFEIEGGDIISGGRELFAKKHSSKKHHSGYTIVYANGYTEFVFEENFDKLRWKPEQED